MIGKFVDYQSKAVYYYAYAKCYLYVYLYIFIIDGHEINHLLYHWKDIDSVTINPEMELPDFILAEVVTKRRNITLSTGLQISLNFPCALVLHTVNLIRRSLQSFGMLFCIPTTDWFLFYCIVLSSHWYCCHFVGIIGDV